MKTNLQRHLGVALLFVSPALLAAKGCSFDADDVPLGSNGEAGEAGANGSDPSAGSGGTSDPSAGTGGSNPSAGMSGRGGTGGAGAGAQGGGDSPGAGGGGEPQPADGPCLEVLTPIDDWTETPLEFSAQEARSFIGGKRASGLYLINGGASTVEFEMVRAELYYVESARNPDFLLDIVVSCEDHVRAKGVARFVSSDDRFDETLHDFELTIGVDEGQRELTANGVTTVEREALRGSYAPALTPHQCLLSVQFNIGFTETDLGGTVLESILSAPCGSNEPNLAVLGRDAGSFSCRAGMDCAQTQLEPAVVVEAASCAGLGVQLTGDGDETTFETAGSVISRAEDWGCGCPQFPEFVLAFSPSSPVELRLCHDDSADSCEAACAGTLSYDLAQAFAIADTTEYRFVD